jgi:hypothetical protein
VSWIKLGFDDLPPLSVILVEWPERAPNALPADRWDIAFGLNAKAGPNYRDVRVTGLGEYAPRAARLAARRRFLNECGYQEALCERLTGDASSRSYQKILTGKRNLLLMDSPRRPDGPPVRDGKALKRDRASRGRRQASFVAIARAARARPPPRK